MDNPEAVLLISLMAISLGVTGVILSLLALLGKL